VSGPSDEEIQRALADIRHREMKQAHEHVLERWLDKQYEKVGRWTMRGFTVAVFGALVAAIIYFKTGSPGAFFK
jgi:hypothetical protein